MKIQFDAGQAYQLDAINAVVNVFADQPASATGLTSRLDAPFGTGGLWSEMGIGNALTLDDAALFANVQAVQVANDLPTSEGLAFLNAGDPAPETPLPPAFAGAGSFKGRDRAGTVVDANRLSASDENHPPPNLLLEGEGIEQTAPPAFPNFAIEMETGTGKTYVYLRTVFELNRVYGFNKFIVVVPSVAIREGVTASLALMAEHFRALFGNVAFDTWVYDSKQVSRVRPFAASNTLQLMVMNIDAFNKSGNVIHKENDRLSGHKPLEFIQAARPIVVMDEPQNMESEQARAAIANLAPLCTLRYSATHRNTYNLLYKLDPVRAYDLKLVKRIEVDSVLDQPGFNQPYVALKSITATSSKITAKLEMDVNGKDGPRRTEVKVQSPKHPVDLFVLSGGREQYRGWIIDDLNYQVASAAIKAELRAAMIDGIKYERIEGGAFDQMLFENEELYGYLSNTVPVNNSIFEAVPFESKIEHDFAVAMSIREDVKLCVKLPPWFTVATPLGPYNPDCAIVLEHDHKVYLVRETKGSTRPGDWRADEADKISCGKRHFAALGVGYDVVTRAEDVR